MTALVLHLSDIHIKTAKDPILKRSQEIAASVTPSLPAATHVFEGRPGLRKFWQKRY